MSEAVIIARGGSKRIPRKNIKLFLGVPILERTIKKAQDSGIFNHVYVSTDDPEIIELSERCEAIVLRRSAELSSDFATTLDVMAEVASHLIKLGASAENVLTCIYPVTPLLNYHWISEAISLQQRTKSKYTFPAQTYAHPIQRAFSIDKGGRLVIPNLDIQKSRTQDLSSKYHDAGQFYVGEMPSWLNRVPIMSNNSTIIELPKYEVLDIDDEIDWKMAEEIFKIRGLAK
jgi:pseudaminic acid cytidylyltransferase